MKISKAVLGAIAITLGLAGQSVNANVTTYSLDNGNSAISGYSAPYGTVTVDLTSTTTATITFNSGVENGKAYLFGDVFVNVDANSWSVSGISAANSGTGFSTGGYSDGGNAGQVDGRGKFNQAINNNNDNGFSASATSITFTLTDTSGTWAGANNVLLANSGNGNFAAAHVFVTLDPPIEADGAYTTGYAGAATTTTNSRVPDGGSTLILLGFAMMGLGSVRAWFGRK
jgi:hypothetical protein